MIAGFVGGFVGAMVSTGNLGAAFDSGILSAITAGLTNGIGIAAKDYGWNLGERAIGYVAVGCIGGGFSASSSANCGNGALSAAFALAARPLIIKVPSFGYLGPGIESVEAGLIGGKSAEIAGGKFEDGFSTSAVQYLADPQPQQSNRDNSGVLGQIDRDLKAIAVDIYAVTVGQLGALYVFFRYDLRSIATDLSGGFFSQAAKAIGVTVYDLLLPHYGYYGGSRWGTLQFPAQLNGQPSLAPLNALDNDSFKHDVNGASGQWASNNFDTNTAYLPAGPFGMAYEIIGLIPFTIAGALGR